jgi:hypothetical protein
MTTSLLVEEKKKDGWIGFSELDKIYYTALLSSFTIATSLISHPLTVLAVRQQTGVHILEKNARNNIISNLLHAYHTIGLRGLFRGFIPIGMMSMPSNIIYFNIVESSREQLQSYFQKQLPNASTMTIDIMQVICSSILAKFLSLIPYVPGELLSSKLMIQDRQGMNLRTLCSSIYQKEGIPGFFRGFNASFYVNITGSAVWWFTYTRCKRYGVELFPDYQEKNGRIKRIFIDSGAGLCSGLSAALVTHPLDTIKTRIMTNVQEFVPNSSSSSIALGCGRLQLHLHHHSEQVLGKICKFSHS